MTEILYRRNVVWEVLRSNRREIHRLWLLEKERQTERIAEKARSLSVPVETADKQRLTKLAENSSHQGVVAEVSPYPYSSVDDMLALAYEKGERPLLLLFDLLHGPQNIGTLLRTADACGAHGVIMQDRRAPDITPSVAMYSAGATEHLLITQVTNLVKTIQMLKRADVWIAGLDLSEKAQMLDHVDLNMALGIVLGHEGSGMRRLVRENCDLLVKLPMRGQIASLNVATAGAVVLYAAWQARGFEGGS